MRKKFRFLTVLAVCVMVLSCFSVTAFAYADDTEQNLPVTEATQPEQQPAVTPTPEKPKGEPIDDEGNAYTRDLLYDKATNKQFITVQTKSGNRIPSQRLPVKYPFTLQRTFFIQNRGSWYKIFIRSGDSPCKSHGVRYVNIVWLDFWCSAFAHRHERLNAVFNIVACSGKNIEFAPVVVDVEQLPKRTA